MSRRLLALPLLAALLAAGLRAGPREDLQDSVVRLVVHHQKPDYFEPWRWSPPMQKSGQGLVVGPDLVLTLASVASGALLVEMRLGAEPVPVRLVPAVVDHDRNLALLRGQLPARAKPLAIPADGDFQYKDVRFHWKTDNGRFLEGSGQLVRAEPGSYAPSAQLQAWYTVSNASIGGGFGEPVFMDGRLVGIGCAPRGPSEFSVLPCQVIVRALDLATGLPRPPTAMCGFEVFPCTQPALRKKLGVAAGDGGCLVEETWGQGTGSATLRGGDLLLALGGRALDAWGRYEHPLFGAFPAPHLLAEVPLDGRLEAEVVRDGERKTLALDLAAIDDRKWVVRRYPEREPSPYLVRGGLVFQPLSQPFMEMWGKDWTEKAPLELQKTLADHLGTVRTPALQEVVLLSHVLAHEVNRGLQHLGPTVVSKADGKPLAGLRHLKAVLDDATADTVRLSLLPGDMPLVLSKAALLKADPEVEREYAIPAPDFLPEDPAQTTPAPAPRQDRP